MSSDLIPGIDSAALVEIDGVFRETQESVAALLIAAGLDPKTALRDADLRGWNFSNVDVGGVDFTNSDLRGTGIEDAIRDDTTVLSDAILDSDKDDTFEGDELAATVSSYDALVNLYVAMQSAQSLLAAWTRTRQRDLKSILGALLEANGPVLANSLRFTAGSTWSLTIYAADTSDGEPMLRAIASYSDAGSLESVRAWPSGVGLVGMSFQRGQELVVPDLATPEGKFAQTEGLVRSVVAMPIKDRDKVWGVIVAATNSSGHFDAMSDGFQNIEPVRALANVMSLAVAIDESNGGIDTKGSEMHNLQPSGKQP